MQHAMCLIIKLLDVARSIVWRDRDRQVLTASSEGQVYLWEACTGKKHPDTYQVTNVPIPK